MDHPVLKFETVTENLWYLLTGLELQFSNKMNFKTGFVWFIDRCTNYDSPFTMYLGFLFEIFCLCIIERCNLKKMIARWGLAVSKPYFIRHIPAWDLWISLPRCISWLWYRFPLWWLLDYDPFRVLRRWKGNFCLWGFNLIQFLFCFRTFTGQIEENLLFFLANH